jgi:hypothetical protein
MYTKIGADKSNTGYVFRLLALITGLLILSQWLDSQVLIYIAIALGFLGLVSSQATAFLVGIITRLAAGVIGKLLQIMVLALIFWVLLTPLAVLRRLLRSKRSEKRFDSSKNTASFFHRAEHWYQPSDLEAPG